MRLALVTLALLLFGTHNSAANPCLADGRTVLIGNA